MSLPKHYKPVIYGILAGFILLLLYFSILSISNSFDHALDSFIEMWYWIMLLVVGFGVQVGLYFHIREGFRALDAGSATTTVAAAGGVSTTSMVACCAHHLTDVLPIIGFSAAAAFLAEYQLLFIIIGVFSNLVGITMMFGIIQQHGLFSTDGSLRHLLRYDMKAIRKVIIAIGLIVVLAWIIV
ncbi:MAG: hypothetical protein SCH70_07675 [Candidatus Methanoperedens sp.]|nr:hypothetical protein [Candidatus Methanoperedens sp.]